MDESGIDMNICKDRGWGFRGKKLISKKSGKHYERTNIISGYVNNESIAPLLFNGTCNRLLFEEWVEKCLTKELKSGQVVVMDNAAFHKSDKVKDLIESVGCELIFLPSYSPDFNPIEKYWANLKRFVKQQISHSKTVYDAIHHFFLLHHELI